MAQGERFDMRLDRQRSEFETVSKRIEKRQAMPLWAFWSAAELRATAVALGDDFGLLFIVLSYRWLTKVRV